MAFSIEGFTFRGCKDTSKASNHKSGSNISRFLNEKGLAFREGYHCAEPLHDKLGVGPTLRFSLGIYTNKEDIKYAANMLKQAVLSGLN
jgi:selenocysteine lyase/cysteine desulfurase